MIPIAVLKYRDPLTDEWIAIGVPGVYRHSDLEGLDTGDPHPQYLLKSGGAMTGMLVVLEPLQPTHVASKGYVDARAGAYAQPESPGDPNTMPAGIRTALWVDTDEGVAGADFLPATGGVIVGNLAVTGFFTAPSAPSNINGHRKITVATTPPPDGSGSDGDVWFQRVS